MGGNRLHADTHHILKRDAKADGLHDARRAGLELHRRVVIGHGVLADFANHVAAAHEGAHFGHPFFLDKNRARARGPVKLVPGDGIEITAQGIDIDRHMHRTLASVDQHGHALGMGGVADCLYINFGPQDIGKLCNCDQFGARRDGVDHLLRIKIAACIHINPLEGNALAFAQEMPGHDIGVMLHHRQENLIARLHAGHGPAVGDHVDALGGAGIQNDLILIGNAEKPRNRAAHGFVFFGRQIAEVMQPAMHIGIFVAIGGCDGINYHLRLLRRGPIIKVNQRLAIHFSCKNRKVGANFLYIEHLMPLPWRRRRSCLAKSTGPQPWPPSPKQSPPPP